MTVNGETFFSGTHVTATWSLGIDNRTQPSSFCVVEIPNFPFGALLGHEVIRDYLDLIPPKLVLKKERRLDHDKWPIARPASRDRREDDKLLLGIQNAKGMQEKKKEAGTIGSSLVSIPDDSSEGSADTRSISWISEVQSSQTSFPDTLGAPEEFADLLLHHEGLIPLFNKAGEQVDGKSFKKQFKFLLKIFSADLAKEAGKATETAAA